MLFLGNIKAAQCSVKRMANALNVYGSKDGFCGYKIDSVSGDNGIFAEWHIDNDKLTLSNDKFGMFPIFYTTTPDSIDFSSSIVDLLKDDNQHRHTASSPEPWR